MISPGQERYDYSHEKQTNSFTENPKKNKAGQAISLTNYQGNNASHTATMTS